MEPRAACLSEDGFSAPPASAGSEVQEGKLSGNCLFFPTLPLVLAASVLWGWQPQGGPSGGRVTGTLLTGREPHLWPRHRASTAAQREGRSLTRYEQQLQPARPTSRSAAWCLGDGQLASQFVIKIFVSGRPGSFAIERPTLDFSNPSEFIMCGAARC